MDDGKDPQGEPPDLSPPDTHLYRVCAFHLASLHRELGEFRETLSSLPLDQALFYSQGGQDLQKPMGPGTSTESPRFLVEEVSLRDPSLGESLQNLLRRLGHTEDLLQGLVSNCHEKAGPPPEPGPSSEPPGARPRRRLLGVLHRMSELGYGGLIRAARVELGHPRDEARAVRLAPADCRALAQALGDGTTQRLELTHCGAGPGALEEMVGRLTLCTSLRLSWNNLGNGGMNPIAACLQHPDCRIQELWLDNNDVGEAGCRILAKALARNSTLQRLSLSQNPIGDTGLRALCGGLSSGASSLQVLRLSSCTIGQGQCGLLARTLASSLSFVSLDLDNNRLGDEGVRSLLGALRQPACRLRTLRLCSNGLTPWGALELSRALRGLPFLRRLTLSYNRLGSLGAKRLCTALRGSTSRLQRLELEGAGLADDCSQDLADSLGSNTALAALCLSRNAFTDRSLESFLWLTQTTPCLQSLWLCRNKFSAEGVRRLQSGAPDGVTVFV
ncbi:ribonuclease inhibitor-like isoform X1 [Mobula birostris]|uniref:ribonuclease inhibitor-like isoform X1 n=1 Tax=Mobula birostris TaxID=1983395 RepID=UPI003B28014A